MILDLLECLPNPAPLITNISDTIGKAWQLGYLLRARSDSDVKADDYTQISDIIRGKASLKQKYTGSVEAWFAELEHPTSAWVENMVQDCTTAIEIESSAAVNAVTKAAASALQVLTNFCGAGRWWDTSMETDFDAIFKQAKATILTVDGKALVGSCEKAVEALGKLKKVADIFSMGTEEIKKDMASLTEGVKLARGIEIAALLLLRFDQFAQPTQKVALRRSVVQQLNRASEFSLEPADFPLCLWQRANAARKTV